jgi:hypothetical protein
MATLQDRIKRTLARLDPHGADSGAMTPFDDVLNQFVATLTSEAPYVGAAIEKGQRPQMRSLVTWPRYRRDERTIMLTFWWDGTTMRVLDERDRPPFSSPDDLSDYLVDYLEKSPFLETLAEYDRRCKEDVDGFLRTENLVDGTPNDVMVVVQAADQKRLAEAVPGSMVNLVVVPERLPSTGEYSDKAGYRYLSSAGYGVRVITHGLAGGKVHLSGEVMGPGEAT